jgi:Methyltransferase domain
VVDEHPRFHLDALRWFASLTKLAGVSPTDLVVHVVGTGSSEVLDYLRSQGVTVCRVEGFDPRSPHCNKIAGALRLADQVIDGMAVLCDTDVALLEDPRPMSLEPGAIAGKIVDAPVPPLDVLLTIFAASGLPVPPKVQLPWGQDEWTLSGNNNGGLYLVPGPLLATVATAWAHWAGWLLDRADLLEEWAVYVDQVSMALALASEGIASAPLDVRWNTPTHDPTRIRADASEPAGIHYHQEVDRRGRIRMCGSASIDRSIGAANRAIDEVWQQASPATSHQRWLSMTETEPTEPTGRRKILGALLEALEPESVLELGSVDSGISLGLSIGRYTRIEPTEDVLQRADLTICFHDGLQHGDAASYQSLLARLWQSARRALVVSGYEDPAASDDPTGTVREPLSVTLQRTAGDGEIYLVSREGSAATFVVLRTPVDAHPRDFEPGTLAPLAERHPYPLSLIALRLDARRTTGFYPDHAPRLWEYPVVAQLVAEHLPAGSRLVDVGAGVTPLAPFLTGRGYQVDTVDPSLTIRTWPPQPDWNEWGFLDYGSAGLAHRSWNCTLGELPASAPFDGVYSVSVIEHLPATVRRELLADISTRTRRGGLVVLTVDLVRGSDDLWNRNLEIQVEDPAAHGTFQDVIDECATVGLELFRDDKVREWGETRVDIGLLSLRQTVSTAARPPPARDRRIRRKLRRLLT